MPAKYVFGQSLYRFYSYFQSKLSFGSNKQFWGLYVRVSEKEKKRSYNDLKVLINNYQMQGTSLIILHASFWPTHYLT